jgi:hypothetical protein
VPFAEGYDGHVATLREQIRDREDQKSELRQFRADGVAARLSLSRSLFCGALAGLAVFFVPVVVVLGSMLLVSVTYNFGVWPLEVALRLVGWTRSGTAPDVSVGRTEQPTPAAVLVAPPVEGILGAPSVVDWGSIALVMFWPVAMPAIGATMAAVHRARRRRMLTELERAPLEFPILPEVVLFYALTGGAGLLVGIGSFVAVGANVIFAWSGYLIWRWLYGVLAWKVAPVATRAAASAAVEHERDYRKRQREAG